MKYEGVSPEWLDIALNIMNRYGGMEGYLRNVIGLDDQDFAALRAIYLEPAEAVLPLAG